ncbi:bacteriorhodopsin-like [Sediminicurvatus halobius]|uniref:Xanthorhodopsin n=1 Tax=Sediminicurvatus halobius TaxID=2182432 RepID=A0A2U2N8S2_9GAMM|nr:bacteriorhodopsin-like [Spiribacter halobius]PWG65482.1 xanthorhodopsin [Spiribacter halobius]UEX76505.1 bacteriorhodopsin [Spiribacter halobius]
MDLELTFTQYNIVYNAFSFTIAAMGATTIFLFLQRGQVAQKYKGALAISGLVTLIALYHYWRIFESWGAAYTIEGGMALPTGEPFNDAYRYVDWLLTVPLLLIELILVMGLSSAETRAKATRLGLLAAIMVILGYPGEISQDAGTRWLWWFLAMIPFVWIVYELFVGLRQAIDNQPAEVRGLVSAARWITVVSWSFYPIVFIFPMIGLTGGTAYSAIQVGYSVADVVAKAFFGLFIYVICARKSELEFARSGAQQPAS